MTRYRHIPAGAGKRSAASPPTSWRRDRFSPEEWETPPSSAEADPSRVPFVHQQFPEFFDLPLHPVHLFVVVCPHLTPFHRLAFGHLRGAHDLVHKIAEQPDADEPKRDQDDEERP